MTQKENGKCLSLRSMGIDDELLLEYEGYNTTLESQMHVILGVGCL